MSSSWRRSQILAAVVFVAVVAVQFGIPISRLVGPGQAQRFGWQMFSGSRGLPEMIVVTATGEQQVTIDDYLLRQRVEIDVVDALPPHLCVVIPKAVAVEWDGGSYTC